MYLQECKFFLSFSFTAFSPMERIWLTFSRALIKFGLKNGLKKSQISKIIPPKQTVFKPWCMVVQILFYKLLLLYKYRIIPYILYIYNVWMCVFILSPHNCWIFWIFQLNPIISIFHFSKHQRIRIMDLKWIWSNSKYMGRN